MQTEITNDRLAQIATKAAESESLMNGELKKEEEP